MQKKDVFRSDLQQTLLDIEDWVADVRELLDLVPADSKIGTISGKEKIIKPIRGLDDARLPRGAPAIVGRRLRKGGVTARGVCGIILPCPQVAQECFEPPLDPAGAVRGRDLWRAMRGIEILAGVCRHVMGQRGFQTRLLRPRRPGTK